MNKFKIDSLSIKNFKGITSLNIRFDEKSIVVLDGPNGYGKTTIFDAIDIILTGFPRKYKSVDIDGRNTYDCSPIHNDQTKSMELSLTLKNSDESICITRCFGAATKGRCKEYNIKNVFDSSTLYINSDLSRQSDLDNIINYPSIVDHFNVLNYVEQDENTFFVKKNPKDRYDDLSSILGAHNQVAELECIRKYSDQIKKIIHNKDKRKKEIDKANKNVIYSQGTDVKYSKLLVTQDYAWDKEYIPNSNIETHQEYLKIIGLIKKLIENKYIIANIKLSDSLHNYINNEEFLQKITTKYWSINNFELLQKEDIERKELERSNTIITQILSAITKVEYETLIEKTILDFLQLKDLNVDIDLLKSEVESIISLKASLTTHNSILSNLKDRQQELIKLFSDNREIIGLVDGECPTCGFQWSTSVQMLEEIQKTSDKIFQVYNNTNKELEIKKETFKTNYIAEVQNSLSKELDANSERIKKLISLAEFSQLSSRHKEYSREFNAFLGLFTDDYKLQVISIVDYPELTDEVSSKSPKFNL
ncbi:MAG: AAA family ATPase [bacterium]